MDDGDGGLHALVVQILEEVSELHGGEHALVRDGTGGQGGEVDAYLMLDALADAEGLAIQVHAGQSTVRRGDHESLEPRHGGKGLQAKAVRVGGHHAPGENFESLLAHDFGDGLFLLTGGFDIAVEEGDACGIVAGFGQFGGHGGTHEFVRHAHQDAGAVARVLLGTHSTAVVEIDQHLDGVSDDFAFRTLVQSGDHTHTTGVMLVGGIIHTVRSVDREIERGFECHRNHLNWLWTRKGIVSLRSLLLTQYRCSMSFTFRVSIFRIRRSATMTGGTWSARYRASPPSYARSEARRQGSPCTTSTCEGGMPSPVRLAWIRSNSMRKDRSPMSRKFCV